MSFAVTVFDRINDAIVEFIAETPKRFRNDTRMFCKILN